VHLPKPISRPIPLLYKIALSVVIVAFLLIGLVGLILPVIPGVLFLVLAVFLLTRVSRRAATYAHSQPWFHRHMRQFNASSHLSATDRLKYGFLIGARAMINGAKRLIKFEKKA